MADAERYWRRKVSKMLAEWGNLRRVCREQGTPDIQDAVDECEEWIDFAFGAKRERADHG